jgi:hypothetical protein
VTAPVLEHQPALGDRRPRIRPGDRFLLRVAGLPYEALHGLRFPVALAWADQVLAGETRLAADGARISDLLHGPIGALPAGRTRQDLITLRRRVFRNQAPADPGRARTLAAEVGGPAGAALVGWLAERERWEHLLRMGPQVVGAESDAARAHLRALAEHGRFRTGLLLASAPLDHRLDDYLRRGAGPLSKRERRAERSLVEYLHRTAAKTSPFSTLTGVTLGEFADTAAADTFRIEPVWRSHPRISVAVLTRIAALIADAERLRPDLPVAVTSGWRAELDRIRFVRRTVRHGSADTAATFDFARDEVLSLRRGPALARALELVDAADHEPVALGVLAGRLAAAVGAEPAEAADYLRILLNLGLLQVPALRVDVHDADPMRAFAGRLRELARPWAVDVAGRLEGCAGLLDGYATADLAARREILTRLRGGLADVVRVLSPSDGGEPADSLPRTLIYEDARVSATPVRISARGWAERVGEPLAALDRVLPVFDRMLPDRLLLKGFFEARFGVGGRCDDLIGLVRDFQADLYEHYTGTSRKLPAFGDDGDPTPTINWLNQPELTALDAARREFVERMRQLWAGTAPGAAELVLDDDFLDAVGIHLDRVPGTDGPRIHFVQPAASGEPGPAAVLNQVYGGHGFAFSRFTHCFADTAGAAGAADEGLATLLRDRMAALAPDGAVFAELVGGPVTSNLNLHGRLTGHQVVCPGERSTVPPEDRIPVEDLFLVHDPATDRLVLHSRRLGRAVIPLYLGYLVPMALPEVPRILMLLAPSTEATVAVWGGVPEHEDALGVRARPRVRHHGLVVGRRSWKVRGSTLPVHPAGAGDAEVLLSWRRWQRERGLPDEVFVRTRGGQAEERAEPGENGEPGDVIRAAGGRWSKPRYLDFAGLFGLRLLDEVDRDAAVEVEFQEMAPAAAALPAVSPEGRHVAEMVVEMSGPRPGEEEER